MRKTLNTGDFNGSLTVSANSRLAVILLSLLFTGCMLWGDLDAIRDSMMRDRSVSFTLLLDTAHLTDGDTVSFSASGSVMQTSAVNGETVTVYYTLANTHNNNWFAIYVDGSEKYETFTPGSRSCSYTVNSDDADNGVIKIYAHSTHSNLNLLLPPTLVHFEKPGKITITGHPSNPADTTFSFTLYKGDMKVPGFIDQPIQSIASGVIPSGIETAMLATPGVYHVKVQALTGHSSIGMTKRYTHLKSSDLNEITSVQEKLIAGL